MSYRESQVDKDNFRWFQNYKTRNTLVKLKVSNGNIRSITPVEISFEYPITAIVGENGAGKSTILALAACAFHNNTSFFPQNRIRGNVKRKRNYYTYSDFFTFSPNETGISGIEICSEYLTSSGIKKDTRKKKPSGKWNDYIGRPKRAVTYLGINRIVPPSESNPHRLYCHNFVNQALDDEKMQQLETSMTHIIGRPYSEIELKAYGLYQLFEAKRVGVTYTGFNMGAGENAVLGLILEILKAGQGALIVIDEIELGLHTQAQIRLIEELKNLCKKYQCQILCSTHSKEILESLPPEGRIFIKRSDDHTDTLPKISPEYAFGRLSGIHLEELRVFVEDDVGKAFVENSLPLTLRDRINILPIGSDQAVLKHMAVHYRERNEAFISFLDGDKRTQTADAIKKIKNHLESRLNHSEDDFVSLMKSKLNYLPGDNWPEYELIKEALTAENYDFLVLSWDTTKEEVKSALEEALAAGKHNEFYTLSTKMCLKLDQVRSDIIKFYKQTHTEIINTIVEQIEAALE